MVCALRPAVICGRLRAAGPSRGRPPERGLRRGYRGLSVREALSALSLPAPLPMYEQVSCQCEWKVHRRMAAFRLLLVRRDCEAARAGARRGLEAWPGATPGVRDQRPGRGGRGSLRRRAAATRWIHDEEAGFRRPSRYRTYVIRSSCMAADEILKRPNIVLVSSRVASYQTGTGSAPPGRSTPWVAMAAVAAVWTAG